jgi:Acetyl-coenzyme A transporter 1
MRGLGFSAGIPYLLVYVTQSAWLSEANVPIETMSELTIAYKFKFVWAPFLDKYDAPIFSALLGRRRGWIVVSQMAVMLALAGVAFSDPAHWLGYTVAFCLALGVAGAKRLLDGGDRFVEPVVTAGELGGDAQLRTRNACPAGRLPKRTLVLIVEDGIEQPVAGLDGADHPGNAGCAVQLVCAEADGRHGGVIIESDRRYVGFHRNLPSLCLHRYLIRADQAAHAALSGRLVRVPSVPSQTIEPLV